MINRFSDNNVVVLEGITEEQEKNIDNNKTYVYKNFFNDEKYAIGLNNILFYGKIDVENEEDIRIIKKFNPITDFLSDAPPILPVSFDYNSASSDWVIDDRHPNGYREIKICNDCIEWFKYCYTEIGRPERIIAFKTHIKYLK